MAIRQRDDFRLLRAGCAFLAAVALVLLYAVVFGEGGLRRYLALRRTLAARAAEVDARVARNHELWKQLERVRHDPRTLEQLARTRLGVAGKDEVVYLFPPELTSTRSWPHSSGTCGMPRCAP